MAHTFHVGQRVRIRTIESMLKDFGPTDRPGIPNVRFGWTGSGQMNALCGRTATIASITGVSVALSDWSELPDREWSYSVDMIEPLGAGKETPAQKRARAEKEKLQARLAAIEAKEKAEREKAAAAEKAKAEKLKRQARDKARAKLPQAAKRALLYLDAHPDAFGCQRGHALGIVAALSGVHLDTLKAASEA